MLTSKFISHSSHLQEVRTGLNRGSFNKLPLFLLFLFYFIEPFNPVAPSQKDQGAISPPSQFVNSSAPPVNVRVSPPVQQATPPPPPQFQSKTVVPPPPTHKPPPPPGANPTTSPRDPPPRNGQPSKVPPPSSAAQRPVKKTIRDEEWFHGPMTRKIGEALLEEDGEFLVRESTTTPGQYVLSGMLNGQPKHLLLVDPQGRVSLLCRMLRFILQIKKSLEKGLSLTVFQLT